MKKLIIIGFWAMMAMGCQTNHPQPIQIAAAANTQYALEKIAKAFTDSTGFPVELIFGASGKLTTQLVEGAPYDVFLAANMEYPMELFRRGLVVDSPQVYAQGQLVLWSHERHKKLSMETLDQLPRIAIANPQIAPYGLLTLQILEEKKLWDKVEGAFVFGESISQVNQYIETEAVDAGFTAKSIVQSSAHALNGSWIDVPSDKYILNQGVVEMKCMQPHAGQKAFMAFLFSPEAQAIFKEFGYNLPGGGV